MVVVGVRFFRNRRFVDLDEKFYTSQGFGRRAIFGLGEAQQESTRVPPARGNSPSATVCQQLRANCEPNFWFVRSYLNSDLTAEPVGPTDSADHEPHGRSALVDVEEIDANRLARSQGPEHCAQCRCGASGTADYAA